MAFKLSPNARALMFWGVCIPLRVRLTLLAKADNPTLLRLFAAGIGVRWLTGGEVGDEGVFGGPAFWAEERVWHGALWSAYALNIPDKQSAWKFLALDTAFGAMNWLIG